MVVSCLGSSSKPLVADWNGALHHSIMCWLWPSHEPSKICCRLALHRIWWYMNTRLYIYRTILYCTLVLCNSRGQLQLRKCMSKLQQNAKTIFLVHSFLRTRSKFKYIMWPITCYADKFLTYSSFLSHFVSSPIRYFC